MNNKLITASIISTLLLSGCYSSEKKESPESIIAKIRAENYYSDAEKISNLQSYSIVNYESFDKKSPFEKFVNKKIIVNKEENMIKPDMSREKEKLEQYDMSMLSLVGVIKGKDGNIAIINDGKKNNMVSVGNYLGKNYGKITDIKEDSLTVEEIIKNEINDYWLKKELEIKIKRRLQLD